MSSTKDTNKEFAEQIAKCRKLFSLKLEDYGTSWRVMRPASLTDQIMIKASRIRSLQEKGTHRIAEGEEAEFIGIVNYANIALIQLELGYGDPIPNDEALALYDKWMTASTKLMLDKNHDYDEAWRLMRVPGITDIILQKIMRTMQIESHHGATKVSEGIDANYMDMVVYALFALILIDENRQA